MSGVAKEVVMKKIFLSLLMSLVYFSLCSCDSAKKNVLFVSDLQKAVNAAYSVATNKAGVSVAIYKDGFEPFTCATGFASGSSDMTTDNPTFAYSITKTFISALILKQIESGTGSYALTSTVKDILSGHPDYGSFDQTKVNVNATVSQLLTHTSGIQDYAENIVNALDLFAPDYSWKPANLVNLVSDPIDSNYSFHYCNTNYILLGMIAEYVSGEALNTLLKNTFFTPLSLSAILAPQDNVPSNIAHPYDNSLLFSAYTDGADLGFMDLTVMLGFKYPTYNYFLGDGRSTWAAGGLVSTAENIAKWGWELYDPSGSAVSSNVRDQIKNSATNDGEYGYGVKVRSYTYSDGTAGFEYGHQGSAPGYRTSLVYETNQGISIAILINVNDMYSILANSSLTDSELGLVDRDSLADALLEICKTGQGL